MDRREFLSAGASGVVAVWLSGCGSVLRKENHAMEKEESVLSEAELDKLTHEWWKTSATDKGGGRFEWDDEIKAVNALTPPPDTI